MKNSIEKTNLVERVALLKKKQAEDLFELKQQYNVTVASITAFNIIKSVANEIISSPDLKSNLINGVIGFGTNYLSKNLINESIANPVKRVLGKLLKIAMKNFNCNKATKI